MQVVYCVPSLFIPWWRRLSGFFSRPRHFRPLTLHPTPPQSQALAEAPVLVLVADTPDVAAVAATARASAPSLAVIQARLRQAALPTLCIGAAAIALAESIASGSDNLIGVR